MLVGMLTHSKMDITHIENFTQKQHKINVSGGMKNDTDILHHPVLEISSNVSDLKGMLKERLYNAKQGIDIRYSVG